jgi:hypothetical protein
MTKLPNHPIGGLIHEIIAAQGYWNPVIFFREQRDDGQS